MLKQNNIKGILNVTIELEEKFPTEFTYKTVEIYDSTSDDIK